MKNEKGFTLVELIVTLAIASILMALSMTIMLSSINTVGRSTVLTEKSQFAGEVYRYVEKILVDSVVIDLDQATGEHTLSVENGRLMLDGTKVYDDSHYYDCDLEITVKNHNSSGSVIDLTVQLKENNGSGYTRSGTFRLLNGTILGSYSGNTAISFTQPMLTE